MKSIAISDVVQFNAITRAYLPFIDGPGISSSIFYRLLGIIRRWRFESKSRFQLFVCNDHLDGDCDEVECDCQSDDNTED